MTDTLQNLLLLVVVLPLIGSIINGFALARAPKVAAHIVGSGAMALSFLFMSFIYIQFYSAGGEAHVFKIAPWISAGSFQAPYALILDRLSGMMMLIVTGIGTLIHIYAGGYMHEEERTYRFFAYLNLFVFMMFQLVLGENLLVTFIGWEGVGLCSYLLIGYWYSDIANANAGMKAFVVNRIGDIGFLLGIFLCFKFFGTVSYSEIKAIIFENAYGPELAAGIAAICFCLFIAVCGKSAQMPLYVWLPDAMAGPTPVSALIHAATMVTAGVYLMCRTNFLFYLAPSVMTIVMIVGIATAAFAASIALVQNDIKRVLAYSTVSQLGYMVAACGAGAFSAGFFHVFTHACFKALLFMGAGSVIVAMHHEQDMHHMGGLRKYMPVTHIVMLIGVLAIIGFPGLAGFFSKDEILWSLFLSGGWAAWGIGVLTACMTAFYMVRLLCLTFYGVNRSDEHTREHLHETSPVMWVPLCVLALLSIFAGYLGVPEFVFGEGSNWIHHYLHHGVIEIPENAKEYWHFLEAHHDTSLEWTLMGASSVAVLISAGFSVSLYSNGYHAIVKAWAAKFTIIYDTLLNKYWVDEAYSKFIVTPLRDMSGFLYQGFDVILIDGLVNASARIWSLIGAITSFRMRGSIHGYATVMVLGIVGLLFMVLSLR